jgi:hypothetical protein
VPINHEGRSSDLNTDDKGVGGQLSETIDRLRTLLVMFMRVDEGLLRELCTLGIITREQTNDIRSKPTSDGTADQLLTIVAGLPDTKQEEFLVALSNNQQTHVSAYMRAKGDLFHIYRDLWPLCLCTEYRIIQEERNKLIELIDCDCGLLDELFFAGFLSDRQMKSVRAQQTDYERNEKLLSLFNDKTYGNFCIVLT